MSLQPEGRIKIAPSLVAAPLHAVGELISHLEEGGADFLHIDIEDGRFVPGVLNLGIRLIEEIRPLTELPLDVHLMVENPEDLLPAVVGAGADLISVHAEACPYPRRTLRQIRDPGLKAGLAFNPKTAIPVLTYLLPLLDYVNILTTEPELPDWPFLPPMLEKVRALDDFREQAKAEFQIQVDGGISWENAAEATSAGAYILVAGRAVFEGGEVGLNLERLRASATTRPQTKQDASR